jgi:hypothetical protein
VATRWTDNHCHLDPGPAAAEAVAEAREAGVTRLVTVGTDPAHSADALATARALDGVWATAGVHPHDAKGGLDGLEALLAEPEVKRWWPDGYYERDSGCVVEVAPLSIRADDQAKGHGEPADRQDRQHQTAVLLDRSGSFVLPFGRLCLSHGPLDESLRPSELKRQQIEPERNRRQLRAGQDGHHGAS